MIDADNLWGSILQYAIQGKLVPQDPNDEPASVLLDRINEEKQRLVKEGKIKKDKKESKIYRKDGRWYESDGKSESEIEVPFEIPNNWVWIHLNDVSAIIMGQSPDGDTVSNCNSGIEFHQGKTLFGSIYLNESKVYTTKPTKILSPNTLVISVRAPVGDVNITSRSICIGRGLAGISPILVDLNYLFTVLLTLKNDLESKGTGTTFKAISAQVLKDELIPIPPLNEQKRIVAKIDELKPLVYKYKELDHERTVLDDSLSVLLRKSLLQYAIQGKLVPQDPNDEPASILLDRINEEKQRLVKEGKIKNDKKESRIYRKDGRWYECIGDNEFLINPEIDMELPDGWSWARLFNIGYLIRGSGIKRNEVKPSGKPCIRYGELYTTYKLKTTEIVSHIDEDLFSKCKKITYGDAVLTLTGECKEDIGKTIVYLGSEEVACGGDLLLIKYHGLDPLFLSYLLNSPQVCSLKAELSNGDYIVHLGASLIGSILLPIPPLNEQKRIVAELQKIDSLIYRKA